MEDRVREINIAQLLPVYYLLTQIGQKDISEFIYNIAVESNDEEAEKRKSKGTSIKKARRKLGIPTLAEIVGCSQKTIAELFRWVGVNHETTEGAAAVTEIIEYGSDRYFVKVKTKVNGILQEKEVQIDGPTLMNQKAFYDAVISKAQVWLPKMKPEFEKTMKENLKRERNQNYMWQKQMSLIVLKNCLDNTCPKKRFMKIKKLWLLTVVHFKT